MIHVVLDESVLKPSSRKTLARNQKSIDDRIADTRTGWAKKKWERFKGNAAQDIRTKLLGVSAGLNLCCYCEHDRAAELEHVFNKKLFPERTFLFSNHIMVCGKCNRDKLDAFAVFHDDTSLLFARYEKRGPSIRPTSTRNVFINPRSENPMSYFKLNLHTGILEINDQATDRQKEQARYTLELLPLNDERSLCEYRSNAVDEYLAFVRGFIGCRDADSFQMLEKHLPTQNLPIASELSLGDVKERGMALFRFRIASNKFPTVWLEMKRQFQEDFDFEARYPRIATALAKVPELLTF